MCISCQSPIVRTFRAYVRTVRASVNNPISIVQCRQNAQRKYIPLIIVLRLYNNDTSVVTNGCCKSFVVNS